MIPGFFIAIFFPKQLNVIHMPHYRSQPDDHSSCNSLGKYLTPFQHQLLRKSLKENLSNLYRQRIEIMLLADEGKSQIEICRILKCCPATVRHWIHVARAGMAHQWQDCPIGRPKAVNDEYLERLKELLSHSPRDYGYSFQRWTVNWLTKQLAKEFGVEVSDRHIKRLLKQMGLSTINKPSNTQENTNKNANNSKIFIRDLKSETIPEYAGFITTDLEKLGRDSDIHGGRYIKGFGFSATVQQYFGSFSFASRISALS